METRKNVFHFSNKKWLSKNYGARFRQIPTYQGDEKGRGGKGGGGGLALISLCWLEVAIFPGVKALIKDTRTGLCQFLFKNRNSYRRGKKGRGVLFSKRKLL